MVTSPSIYAKSIIFADRVCDYIPGASTATNTIALFQKYALLPKLNYKTLKSSHIYTHQNNKSFYRCIILLVPVLGNLVIFICDLQHLISDKHQKLIASEVKDYDVEEELKDCHFPALPSIREVDFNIPPPAQSPIDSGEQDKGLFYDSIVRDILKTKKIYTNFGTTKFRLNTYIQTKSKLNEVLSLSEDTSENRQKLDTYIKENFTEKKVAQLRGKSYTHKDLIDAVTICYRHSLQYDAELLLFDIDDIHSSFNSSIEWSLYNNNYFSGFNGLKLLEKNENGFVFRSFINLEAIQESPHLFTEVLAAEAGVGNELVPNWHIVTTLTSEFIELIDKFKSVPGAQEIFLENEQLREMLLSTCQRLREELQKLTPILDLIASNIVRLKECRNDFHQIIQENIDWTKRCRKIFSLQISRDAPYYFRWEDLRRSLVGSKKFFLKESLFSEPFYLKGAQFKTRIREAYQYVKSLEPQRIASYVVSTVAGYYFQGMLGAIGGFMFSRLAASAEDERIKTTWDHEFNLLESPYDLLDRPTINKS